MVSASARMLADHSRYEVVRLKYLARVVKDVVDPHDLGATRIAHFSIPAFDAGEQPTIQAADEIDSAKLRVPAGAVLVSKLNPRMPRVWLPLDSAFPALASTEFVVLLPGPRIDRRYLGYVCRSSAFVSELVSRAEGSTRSRQRVSPDDVASVALLVPPLLKQRTIAAFLDRETVHIDQLVATHRKLMEGAGQRRDAEIERVVTGRLGHECVVTGNPFLPELPRHWHWGRLKNVSKRVDVGIAEAATHAYADAGVVILRSTNVRANRLLLGDLLRIEPWFAERNRSKFLRAGDIVTVRTGNAGVSAVVPPELDRSQCFTMLMCTLSPGHSPDYFSYYLNSIPCRRYFEVTAWGTAQANISVPILANTPVPIPPPDEQARVAAHVRAVLDRHTLVEDHIQSHIQLLQERRQSLITAAVTGQINVR